MKEASTPVPTARRAAAGPTRGPWIYAVAGVVAGIVLITVAAQVDDDRSGPLGPLRPPTDNRWAEFSGEAPAAVAVRLEQFAHQSFTRTGARWHVYAAALVTDEDGVLLEDAVLELQRGSTVVARLRADEARLSVRESGLALRGGVLLVVGDDLVIEGEDLILLADGTVRGRGSVLVKTPHGRSRGDGLLVKPAAGHVTLSPGGTEAETLRWSGWGQELVNLGEAVRNWSQSTLRGRAERPLEMVEASRPTAGR